MTEQTKQTGLLFEAHAEGEFRRLDMCASEEFELFSRSQYKQRVFQAEINGKAAKPSSPVSPGDRVVIAYLPELPVSLEPENIPLDILFEDADVLVVNKARGMVVHPGAGNNNGTLVNAFLHHHEVGFNEHWPQEFRPGIVHRLDKDTSGVIILAKNSRALEYLSSQFRNRSTKKSYLAITDGILPPQGEISGYIHRSRTNRKLFVHDAKEGKSAQTWFQRLEASTETGDRGHAFMLLSPQTGRTHQLRVHCKSLGAPIHGDVLYNNRTTTANLMLHSWQLKIRIPSNEHSMLFEAPLPEDMISCFSHCGMAHLRHPEDLDLLLNTARE